MPFFFFGSYAFKREKSQVICFVYHTSFKLFLFVDVAEIGIEITD